MTRSDGFVLEGSTPNLRTIANSMVPVPSGVIASYRALCPGSAGMSCEHISPSSGATGSACAERRAGKAVSAHITQPTIQGLITRSLTLDLLSQVASLWFIWCEGRSVQDAYSLSSTDWRLQEIAGEGRSRHDDAAGLRSVSSLIILSSRRVRAAGGVSSWRRI